MNNSLYEIKKLQWSVKGRFKLNINKFEIHRGAIYLISGRIESGKSLVLNILSQKNKYNGDPHGRIRLAFAGVRIRLPFGRA